MNIPFYFYKKSLRWGPSASGKAIGEALGVKREALLSPISPAPKGCVVLNWGVSTIPIWSDASIIWFNCPWNVGVSAHKIRMMVLLEEAGIPQLRQIRYQEEVSPDTLLVARHLLSSHSGIGIEIVKASEMGDAPLYTLLEDFRIEQRIFVVNNKIVDIVQKKKMGKAKLTAIGLEKADPYVKSHRNGWVFARNDIEETPAMAKEIAIEAMIAVGLDFGCVDVAWTDPDKCKVIETNSTPGFKNTITLEKFANAIKEEFL